MSEKEKKDVDLTPEEIDELTSSFLKKCLDRKSPPVKVETVIDPSPQNGYSWTMKITVPPGFLPPEIEEEWRRKNELEKAQSKAAGPESS